MVPESPMDMPAVPSERDTVLPWAAALGLLLAGLLLFQGHLQWRDERARELGDETQWLDELAQALDRDRAAGAGSATQGALQARLALALEVTPMWAALELVDDQGRVLLGTDAAVHGQLQPPGAWRSRLPGNGNGTAPALWLQAVPRPGQEADRAEPWAALPWRRALAGGVGAAVIAAMLAAARRPRADPVLDASARAAAERLAAASARIDLTRRSLARFGP